ncbi:MAG: ABC transporter permease [Gemmatimonadetes bacterium]|nr:ABC transporter permease [Gemmatimonadota bacterium]
MSEHGSARVRKSRRLVERPLAQLTLVRMREFFREPEAIFWTFGFPLLLAGGLAIAFRNKPAEAVPVAVVSGAAGSERVIAALKADSGLVVDVLGDSAAAASLRMGKVALLVEPRGDSVRYRFDSDRAEARSARMIADVALQRAAGRVDPVAVSESRVTEAGSRYIDFFLPGLLGMNLMGASVWSIAFSVVTARSKRLLKRLSATPMRRGQYLASFILSRLVFLAIEVGVILGIGTWMLGVPVRGSLVAVLAITLLAALAFSGIGLLISSRARTVEAVSGLANFVLFPMWIFSGVFFASTRFPDVVQPLIKALPLTATNDALRAVMLQGATLGSQALNLAILTAWLVVTFVAALRLFQWR